MCPEKLANGLATEIFFQFATTAAAVAAVTDVSIIVSPSKHF